MRTVAATPSAVEHDTEWRPGAGSKANGCEPTVSPFATPSTNHHSRDDAGLPMTLHTTFCMDVSSPTSAICAPSAGDDIAIFSAFAEPFLKASTAGSRTLSAAPSAPLRCIVQNTEAPRPLSALPSVLEGQSGPALMPEPAQISHRSTSF